MPAPKSDHRDIKPDTKVMGIYTDRWISMIQTLGIPVILLGLLLWKINGMVETYVPPIVDGHVELLKETTKAIKSIDRSVMAQNIMLATLAEGDYPDLEFRKMVHDEHEVNLRLDTDTHNLVREIHDEVCEDP